MKSYSFIMEFREDADNEYQAPRRKRNWHNPQSHATASPGTIGSYASITSPYNNVYGNNHNNPDNQ